MFFKLDSVIVDSDGAPGSMPSRSKRLLEHPDDEPVDEGSALTRKGPLDDGESGGESMDVIHVEDFGHVCSTEDIRYRFTGEDLFLKDFGDVQSLVYQGRQNFKIIEFCGKSLRVWGPDSAVDNSTLQQLDGVDTFEGMLTEMANLDRVFAGKPVKHDQAVEEAKKFGVKIICCRWVTNA